jgi:Asp-tRNA(Asn)/Glu-tRNA(Gln) amidotransferase A subunit family amidase
MTVSNATDELEGNAGGTIGGDRLAGLNLLELTIAQVQEGFAAGAFTSEDLTRASLSQIARYNSRYNAVVCLNPEALADAREIDRLRAAGQALGPLAGVPVVIKDPMNMRGLPTTAGWSKLHGGSGGINLVPDDDAPVVARMRAAGTIMVGKTNVPILSYSARDSNNSWAGPTLNPILEDRVPGASSAGTATAISSGMAVLGLAEETAGSIQNPSAAQGLVSIKPTLGLVPNAGVVPLSGNRDVVGPIARCVRDAALCLDVLAGFSSDDPKTTAGIGRRPQGGYTAQLRANALTGARIGLYGPGWRKSPLSDETEALYRRVQGELQGRGATLIDDPFAGSGFSDLEEIVEGAKFDIRGMESLPYDIERYLGTLGSNAPIKTFAEFARATEDLFAPGGRMAVLHRLPQFAACLANPGRPPDLSEFITLKETYLSIFEEVFARDRLDALVLPQMREEIPALRSEREIQETSVSQINIAGLPGVVTPAGFYASGAPFCLITIGRAFSEGELLAYAYDYEQATQHWRAPRLHGG